MAVYPERRKGNLTGKWIAEVTRNGERIARKTFAHKRDADCWEASLKFGEKPVSPEATKGLRFGDAAREMLAANPMSRDKSGRERLQRVIAECDSTPIMDVTTVRLDQLVRTLKKRKGKKGTLRPGTINRYLSAVSSVLTYARQRYPDEVPSTPAIAWQKDDGHRLEWLREGQEEQLLHYMRLQGWDASALVVTVLIETGMRWGELAGLKPEQIEPRTGWIRLWVTKNDDPRSAPVSPRTAENLRALIVSGRLPKYYTFRNHLRAAAKSAGLPETFSIHALRHTTATRLTQRGVPLPIVKKYQISGA